MPILLAPPETESVRSREAPAGTAMLALRRSGEPQGQDVVLPPGKHTIGSSPQCRICVPDGNIPPLQCMVLVDERSGVASATRWAAGVRLNGRDFSKATLAAGDVLAMGDWEVELTATPASPPWSPAGEGDDLQRDPWADDLHGTTRFDGPPSSPPHAPLDHTAGEPLGVDRPAVTLTGEPAGCGGETRIAGPAAIEPSPVAACGSSQAFGDRLIVQLWNSAFQARRRAKALITSVRAARFDADARAADFAALAIELDLARAACESHAENDERLRQQYEAQRGAAEQRAAAVGLELAASQAQLESTLAALAERTAHCEALTAELERLDGERADGASAHEAQIAALEAALAQTAAEHERLTAALYAAAEQQQRLSDLYHGELQRATQLEQALAMQAQASAPAAGPCETATNVAGDEAAAAMAPEGWSNQAPTPADPLPDAPVWPEPALEGDEAAAAPLNDWPATDSASGADGAAPRQPAEAPTPGEEAPWTAPVQDLPSPRDEVAPPAGCDTDPSNAGEWGELSLPVPLEEAVQPSHPTADEPQNQAPEVAETATALLPLESGSAAVQSAGEYAATSFIEKYRHLLEEEDDSLPAGPRGRASSHPALEEEFLSPAKAEPCASPSEESDEALEAYMANLMKRVCGAGTLPPASAARHASAEPAYPAAEAALQAASLQPPASSATALEPFDFEALKLASRKTPLASDLNALREIANNSARTAIATSSERRRLESALSRITLAFTATASSAYMMASAPQLNNPQFWAGLGAGVVGVLASAQVIWMERRRQLERLSILAMNPAANLLFRDDAD